MRRPAALLAFLTAAALLAGCTDESKVSPPPTTELSIRPIAALVAFDACDDYLSWIKERALERVGPWGLDGAAGYTYYAEDMAVASRAMEDSAAGMAERAPAAGPATTLAPTGGDGQQAVGDETGTNNQEAGVDEADLVKTDGRRVVTVQDRELLVVDITGVPTLTGRLDLGMYGQSLFLVGDRAYVLGMPDPEDMPATKDVASSTYWTRTASRPASSRSISPPPNRRSPTP
jgi:uncharacterized secreted protein with C-terminal beta-propeller domain